MIGIVGESGCGKTTLGLAVLGLLGRARWIAGGDIRVRRRGRSAAPGVDRDGRRCADAGSGTCRRIRSGRFDPLRRVGPQVAPAAAAAPGARRAPRTTRVARPAGAPGRAGAGARHGAPTRTSCRGGMLQRATIAAALACGPELVIADEPTTALDALVQVQVIEAFLRLVRELGTAVLVITHDLRLLARAGRPRRRDVRGQDRGVRGRRETAAGAATPPVSGGAARGERPAARRPGGRVPTIDGQPPTLPGRFAALRVRAALPACRRTSAARWSRATPGRRTTGSRATTRWGTGRERRCDRRGAVPAPGRARRCRHGRPGRRGARSRAPSGTDRREPARPRIGLGLLVLLRPRRARDAAPLLTRGTRPSSRSQGLRPGGIPLPAGSPDHLLGTDPKGRDLLARVLHGGRVTLVGGARRGGHRDAAGVARGARWRPAAAGSWRAC